MATRKLATRLTEEGRRKLWHFLADNLHADHLGSTAPLGNFKRIAIKDKGDAEKWAAENGINIVKS